LQIAESFLSDPFFAANFSVSPGGEDFDGLAGRRGIAQGDGRSGAQSIMELGVPFEIGDPARYKPYSAAEAEGPLPREFGNVLEYEIRMAETSAAVSAEVQRDRLIEIQKKDYGDQEEQEIRARANWVGEYGPAHTMSIREAIEARGNARNHKGVKPFEILGRKQNKEMDRAPESSHGGRSSAAAEDVLEAAAKRNPRSLAWTLDVEETGASKARNVRTNTSLEGKRNAERRHAHNLEEDRIKVGSELVQWSKDDGPTMEEIAQQRKATLAQPERSLSPRGGERIPPQSSPRRITESYPAGTLAVSSLAPFLFSEPSPRPVSSPPAASPGKHRKPDFVTLSPNKPPQPGNFVFAEDFDAFRKLPAVTGTYGAHGIDSAAEDEPAFDAPALDVEEEDYW